MLWMGDIMGKYIVLDSENIAIYRYNDTSLPGDPPVMDTHRIQLVYDKTEKKSYVMSAYYKERPGKKESKCRSHMTTPVADGLNALFALTRLLSRHPSLFNPVPWFSNMEDILRYLGFPDIGPGSYNFIPSNMKGECKEVLISVPELIERCDRIEEKIPVDDIFESILTSIDKCRHKKVILLMSVPFYTKKYMKWKELLEYYQTQYGFELVVQLVNEDIIRNICNSL